jgi:hypothetical protein
MFRKPLCPSSGAQEYYTVVAACGIQLHQTRENNLSVSFLDLTITRKPPHLDIGIHRKPTTTDTTINQHINPSSEECSPSPSIKKNAVKNGITYYTLHTGVISPDA